jgi:energy-coupling factor transporter ATP-binding protein EcfA2
VVNDSDYERRPVREWLEAVRELFDAEREPQLHGRIVIIGLSLLDPHLQRQLQRTGFLSSLEAEYTDPLNDVLTDHGKSLRTEQDRSLQVPADTVPTQPDRPLEKPQKDQFQRVPFARYLARRIHNISSQKAYSIHLYGPWGSGKSTLLNFLKAELTDNSDSNYRQDQQTGSPPHRTNRGDTPASSAESWQVVQFNAWQHQHVQPPWWALMNNVFQQSKDGLSRRDRLAEYGWRLRTGRLGAIVGVIAIAWIIAVGIPLALRETTTLSSLATTANNVGAILAVIVTVWGGAQAATNSLVGGSAQAAQSYVESVSDPMNTIKDRFGTLITRIPQPVAILVDDLDRCDCEYVVELLEGIQTLFTQAPVVFVVAADRRWITNCFEEVYGDQQPTVNEPGKSIGSLFLEKTFQFSTSVPTIPDRMKEEYWDSLLLIQSNDERTGTETADPSASEAIRNAQSEEEILRVVEDTGERPFGEQQLIRQEAVERLAAPEIVERTEHVLQPLAPLLEPNPRGMKRLVNAYSVNRALATLAHLDIERDQLALWTILSLDYPKLALYLEDNPEMVTEIGQQKSPDIDDELATLFTDQRVVDIVEGAPIAAELDIAAVRQCTKIRQS